MSRMPGPGLTVHVGLHKTGSTSIQAALDLVRHRKDLLIVSPRADDLWANSAKCERIAEASRTRHVIVSDEGILGGMSDAYSSAGERAMQVSGALSDVPYEIVMYVRPQPAWLSSVYLQVVQQGASVSADAFWDSIESRDNLDWSALSACVRKVSGAQRVRIRAYVPGRDSVEDFFACCGLGTAPRPTSSGIRINESISPVQAPILAALNRDETLDRDERLRLRHLFQDRLAGGVTRGWSPFSGAVQAQMVDRFRADWQAVASMLDETDPHEAAVFRSSAMLWDAPTRPCPGSSLSDPVIAEELLRTVKVLAADGPCSGPPRLWRRALAKAMDRPSDIPRAAIRSVRRPREG